MSLKLRYCEKATKLEKNLPPFLKINNNSAVKKTWEIFSKFCGLLIPFSELPMHISRKHK